MAVSYGFKRDSNGMESTPQRVVAYGGNGFFGRVIVDELLRSSTTQIEIASRTAHSVEYAGYDYRVRFVESDLRLKTGLTSATTSPRYVIDRHSFANRTLAKQSAIWFQNWPGVTRLYSGRGKRRLPSLAQDYPLGGYKMSARSLPRFCTTSDSLPQRTLPMRSTCARGLEESPTCHDLAHS